MEFVLLGFTQSVQGQKILFVVFLLIYIVSMVDNLLIVLTGVHPNLGCPYVFLSWLLITYGSCLFYSHLKFDHKLTL